MFDFTFSILSLLSLSSLFSSDLCCRNISFNQETPDRLPCWRRLEKADFCMSFKSSRSLDTWQFDLGLGLSLIYKLYWAFGVCSPRFSQSKD